MAWEQKDNDGACFINDDKQEDWHAEFRGKAMVDGQMYFVDMKQRESSKDGQEFWSLKFKKMTGTGAIGQKPSQSRPPQKTKPRNDFDQSEPFEGDATGDNIPF